MKTMKIYALIGTVLVAMLCVSCSKDDDTDATPAPTTTNLSDNEKAGLLQIVEIEKLHHDVYLCMAENNQCELFDDLCSCDKNFMDLLSYKVDIYKLENPLTERGTGVYANPDLQTKYNEFILISDSQLKEFLLFARQMEEYGLAQLETHLSQVDGNEDIAKLYSDIQEESKCQLEKIIEKIEHRDPVPHPGNLPDDI